MMYWDIQQRKVEIRYVKDLKTYLLRDCHNPEVCSQGRTLTEAKNLYFMSARIHKIDLATPGYQP